MSNLDHYIASFEAHSSLAISVSSCDPFQKWTSPPHSTSFVGCEMSSSPKSPFMESASMSKPPVHKEARSPKPSARSKSANAHEHDVSGIMERRHKRVGKACDRCRVKKTKVRYLFTNVLPIRGFQLMCSVLFSVWRRITLQEVQRWWTGVYSRQQEEDRIQAIT